MPSTWPDLAIFELLVAVGEKGSLSAAARELGMAQPNASRSLARLERQLGIPLLNRTPAGSTLTRHGQLVEHWARDALEATNKLLIGAQSLRSERSSEFVVAASMTVAEHLAPAWLAELLRRHPGTRLHLEIQNSHDVIEQLQSGSLELGFVESPTVPAGIHSTVVAYDDLVVVVDPDHPWTRKRRPLTSRELAATPLIVREPGSGTRTTLDKLLKGLDPVPPLMELSSASAVRVSVASGAAPAVMSMLAVDSAVRAGELTVIDVPDLDLRRTLRAVWRSPAKLDGLAHELVDIARRAIFT
ncbi:MAG: LysR family transcriptional regulator [Aeromicrobium sp.]